MDTQTAPTVSRGRVLAYRIIAGVVGLFFILSGLAFSVPQFFSTTDKVHSFHDLATMPAFLVLLGFALIVMMLRPDDVVALRVAWAVALGAVIAGIIGHDLISDTLYPITVVAIGVLTILAPVRAELLRFGSPNVAMLSLAIVAAIPAIVFAWDNARIMSQGDPMHDVTGHWKYHHWSGVAASALGVVLAAIVVSFSPGERLWTWVVGFATMLFGLAGIIFSDAARYPSSIGTLWGVGVFFVGLVYIVVAEVSSSAGRRGPARMNTRPGTAAPKGIRRLERWFVGVMMGIIAFALEKIVLRSVKKKHPETKAEASTLTSKGGDVDLEDLHLGKGFGKGP